MRLKKITLNNFRCFEHLEVDLHPRLTVIVGNNGTGKTAVLDGIAAGLTPVLTYLSSANQRLTGRGIKDSDFRMETRQGRNGKTRWGVADFAQVVVETHDGPQWDYWRPSSSGIQKPSEKHGEKELKAHLNEIAASYRSALPMLSPVLAYYGARRGHIEVPERLRSAKQNYEHPASALIGALDSLSDFREMLAWFDLEESSVLRAKRDMHGEEEEEEEEDSYALDSVRAAVVSVLGGVYEEPSFNKDHKFVLKRTQDGAPMLVNQLSQGYQSMLAMAMDFSRRLAIANRFLEFEDDHARNAISHATDQLQAFGVTVQAPTPGALATSAPAIMLVDEIDLHLHPLWQQRVLADLMRTFPLTQFIVTTHSAHVVTTTPSDSIRILQNGRCNAAPPGIEGAGPERVLKQVLGVREVRPPTNQVTKDLGEYLKLVDSDQWKSPRAIDLRIRLDASFQGNEPELLEADLRIENRKWELGE